MRRMIIFLLLLVGCAPVGIKEIKTKLPSPSMEFANTFTTPPDLTFEASRSPTELATKTQVVLPTSTQTLAKYSYSNSIDTTKLPILQKWFIGQPHWEINLSDQAGYPFAVGTGFVVSYELVKADGNTEFFISFLVNNKLIKAKVNYVIDRNASYPPVYYQISSLTLDEGLLLSTALNNVFKQVNSLTDRPQWGGDYLCLLAVNNSLEQEKCTSGFNTDESSVQDDLCTITTSPSPITGTQLANILTSSLMPLEATQIDDFFDTDEFLLSPDENSDIVVILQLNPLSIY